MAKYSTLLGVYSLLFSTPTAINNLNYIKYGSKPIPRIRVAVIDTGLDPSMAGLMCENGSQDFTGTTLIDLNGHGTHVSTLIDQYVKDKVFDPAIINDGTVGKLLNIKADYCQIILKYYANGDEGFNNLKRSIAALRKAIDLNVDIINYSSGGTSPDAEEATLFKTALDRGIIIVAAAGNDGKLYNHIDKYPYNEAYHYYPAQYDTRIIVVGNLNTDGSRAINSNYGNEVDAWEIGVGVLSSTMNGRFKFLSGTSQATAIHTGKIIRQLLSP